jgi:hypothetical protein
MLRDGRGVPADLPRAAKLLDRACKGKVPFACTNAGDLDAMLAAKATSPAPHWKSAIGHYKLGCEAGDPTGCRQIGIAYLEARGLPRSTAAAAVWFERACVGDDPLACRVLGAMLIDGVGVARDEKRGQELLARACDRKDDEACRLMKTVADRAASPTRWRTADCRSRRAMRAQPGRPPLRPTEVHWDRAGTLGDVPTDLTFRTGVRRMCHHVGSSLIDSDTPCKLSKRRHSRTSLAHRDHNLFTGAHAIALAPCKSRV